ncbi:MAG TPA: hypothetical protein VHX86_04170 [Tepidisphaeraceae bacterium]|jgi:hypothetical protein|nr:hypothetical protein [Tepidisphaeraceae bacterium]
MLFNVLAATTHVFSSQTLHQSETFFTSVPRTWPQQTDLLTWCQQMTPGVAALLIILGIIYLLFGYQIFKGLVLVNAAVVGAYIGANLGGDGDPATVCAVVGAVAAAAIAWPTMKYSVALMGGFFGALLGASLWRTMILPPNLVWAGALVGLMAFGLLSFILFRGSVMMYTSLQGAFMMVFGILGLIYQYHEFAIDVTKHLKLEPYWLPAAIFIPAVLGLIFQQHQTTLGATASGASHGGASKK